MSSLRPLCSHEPRFLAVIATHDQAVAERLERDFAATIVVSAAAPREATGSTLAQAGRGTSDPSGEPPILTTRQLQILHLLKLGQSNKEIGRALQLSHFTVRNHVTSIFRAVGIHRRWELRNPIE